MQLQSVKLGQRFVWGGSAMPHRKQMVFVDIQQIILFCNEASDWSTALGTLSPEGDRTQGKFCFVHLEISCLRSSLDKPL